MATDSTLLEGLTDPQREAVVHHEGPMLVLAGPGSGKTTAVTRRIALLLERGVSPWSILALTFTNKAAGEMRERVRRLTGGRDTRGLTIATFHAFAARQLRMASDRLGVPEDFTIFDAADQKAAAKQAVIEAGLETSNWPPASVLSAIGQAKQQLLGPEEVERNAGDFYTRSVARIYKAYQKILKRSHALDFDDLLRLLATALRDDASLREQLGSRFAYLMVDEYQDTNHAQFVIASAIAASHGNICVVGDPDQSIYAWRGADISNILDFESQYAGATAISLGQNFRSTEHIVQASSGLIAHNESHRARTLHTELGAGDRPILFASLDEHAEAKEVVDRFKRLHDEDSIPWNEMAVLYRMNAFSRVVEDAFRTAGVPYLVARGTAFYQRKEIKDAMAYLRLLRNEADDISLRRIINVPTRGIGGTTMDHVERFAARHDLSLMAAIRRRSEIEAISRRAATSIDRFLAMVDGWHRAMSASLMMPSLAELVARVLDESGLEKAHRAKPGGEEDTERIANLQELVSAAADRDALQDVDRDDQMPTGLEVQLAAWLEAIALVADADTIDPEQGAVTLMTLHAAKGLEFDAVAIIGCEQGVLPHSRAFDDLSQLEEERRLCYVGMTRARRRLLLGRAMSRTQRGIQERQAGSQFLDEIPPEAVRVLEPEDPWASASRVRLDVHPGQPVRHPRFGLGRVVRFGRRPQGATVTVDFVEFGARTLPAAHAALEPTDASDPAF
ncbi:MAG: UvrD-helicase domain-containing protein [Phycisphaerales bacterium]|jgi:DNA helicase-2/ATP-dependent DNA helicase PcrA|nr:UvrD-helicase domain-containing protein [Phycisphaerales bacterium]